VELLLPVDNHGGGRPREMFEAKDIRRHIQPHRRCAIELELLTLHTLGIALLPVDISASVSTCAYALYRVALFQLEFTS
ncbi:unnamed protein product, partial [Mycena citricolor]